jgi:radical SAM protein with 4Fe4S-binding SPASM domain
MRKFILQWHLLENCNLKCTHCYQNEELIKNELTLEEKYEVVDSFVKFVRGLPFNVYPHITLTGGEPFLYNELEQLLKYMSTYKNVRFSFLSNGTFISEKTIELLKKYEPEYVQISIDGGQKVHDEIRGHGAFSKALEGLQSIKSIGITTSISFTAHKQNYKDIPEVIRVARKIGVNRFWSDRLIPEGHGKELEGLLLSPNETYEYVKLLKKEAIKAYLNPFNKLTVGTQRALQFFPYIDKPYSCTAGQTLLTLMPDGTVYPCRRLPIPVGNIKKNRFEDIYYENGIIKDLQNNSNENCAGCKFEEKCRGGLKCLAYATTGSMFNKDPGCWR